MSDQPEKQDLVELPKFSVRAAKMKDVQTMARVHVTSWRQSYRGIIDDDYLDEMSLDRYCTIWAQIIARKNPAFIAKWRGRIVGVANGGPVRSGIPNIEMERTGELYILYVLDHAKKIGIGRALFDSVQLALAEQGLSDVAVRVLKDNPACGFYDAMGGDMIGTTNVEIGQQFLEEKIYLWNEKKASPAKKPGS